MKSRLSKKSPFVFGLVLCVLIFAAIGVRALLSSHAEVPNMKLYISPTTQSVNAGSNIVFNVMINTAGASVNTVQSEISYSNTNFNLVSIAPSTSFNGGFPGINKTTVGSTDKVVFNAAVASGGVSGVLTVVTVTLQATGAGTSPVSLSAVCPAGTFGFSCSAAYDATDIGYPNDLSTDPNNNPITNATFTVNPPPDNEAPSTPGSFSATAISDTEIDLSWAAATDNVAVTQYEIYRGIGSTAPSLLTTINSATSFKNTGLTPNTSYRYYIKAKDAAGNASAQTAPVAVSTLKTPDTIPPTAPTSLTFTSTTYNKVDLAWSGATDNTGVASYDVYRGAENATPSLLKNLGNVSTYSDTTVAANTKYSYYVIAKDADGNSSQPSTTQSTTTPKAPDTTPPSKPLGVSAQATSDTQVSITWSPSSDDNSVTKYRVYTAGTNTILSQPTTTSFNHTGLKEKTQYSYEITAVDAAGNESPRSLVVSATTLATPDTTLPTTSITSPVGTQPIAVGGSVHVVATASDNVGVARVELFIDGVMVTSKSLAPYDFNWDVSILTNGVSHTIQSKAYDTSNNLGSSSIVNVTVNNPDVTAPSEPTGLAGVAAGPTSINLNWATSPEVDVTGYYVLRNGVVVATVNGKSKTSYQDSGLTASTSYAYSIEAFDGSGNTSIPSVSALISTSAAPADTSVNTPTGLSATLVSSTQVNLTWNAVTDPSGITGYNVYRNGAKVATVTTTSWGQSGLSAGTTYSYTVSAVDGATNESTKSTAANVSTPTPPPPPSSLTIIPSDDAYVDKGHPRSNYGRSPSLQTVISPTKYTLFKFNVRGVAGKTVTSAKLKLRVNNGSVSGGNFHKITSNNWSQSRVNWYNKPAFNPANIATLGNVSMNSWAEVDLTNTINGDGTYGILINSSSSDSVGYSSRETNTKPQLIIGVR